MKEKVRDMLAKRMKRFAAAALAVAFVAVAAPMWLAWPAATFGDLDGVVPDGTDYVSPNGLDGAAPGALDGAEQDGGSVPGGLDRAMPDGTDSAEPGGLDGAASDGLDGAVPGGLGGVEQDDGAAPGNLDGAEQGDGAPPDDRAPPGFAELFEETDEYGEFDRDRWLGDFDPDEDFGGLGLEPEYGPGSITIDVVGLDGKRIEGIAITESGFRTGYYTSFDAPSVISNLVYGEFHYDVLPSFSYEYAYASLAYYVADAGFRVDVPLFGGRPLPIVIGDAALHWELTVVLQVHMRMKADYFLVSPNNRFYDLQVGPEAPIEYRYSEPPIDAYVPYELNTFLGAPARVAVFMQMPSIRGVSRIALSGEGFAAGRGGEWSVDGELKEFSLTDWSATYPLWQLAGAVISYPGGGGAIGTRFVVFAIPESYEGARIRLDSVTVEMADGSVHVFENPSRSDVTVRIIDIPKLH